MREVATWIGVDPHTLHRWRWDGLGPRHLRAGRGIRYRASDVQIWLTRERDE